MKVEIDIEREKAKAFKKYETYVFVQTKDLFYNGRIIDVHENEFIFLDDKINHPFPILFSNLIFPILPSRKEERKYA